MQDLLRPAYERRGLLHLFRGHWLKIICVWTVLIAGAAVYTSRADRKFSSEAKLFVRLGRESVKLDATATTGDRLSVQESRDGEINSVFELLGSRVILDRVVDVLGVDRIRESSKKSKKSGGRPAIVTSMLNRLENVNLNPFRTYSKRDEAVETLQQNLNVSRPHKTNILVLEYEATSPELSRDVLTAVIDAARDEHLRVHFSGRSRAFFEERTEMFQEELTRLETQLVAFKDEQGIADLPIQRQLHLNRIGVLEEDKAKAVAALSTAQAELANREAALASLPETVVLEEKVGMAGAVDDLMRDKLYELEIEEKKLLAQFQPEHFLVKQVQEQLRMARSVLDTEAAKTETTRGLNINRQAMEQAILESKAAAEGLKASIASLEEQIAAASAEVKQLNDAQLRIARFERDLQIAGANYVKYRDHLEQTRVDQSLESEKISNLSMLQPPSYSVTPTSPDIVVNFALAGMLATFLTGAIVVLSEWRAPAAGHSPAAEVSVDGSVTSGSNGKGKPEHQLPVSVAPSVPR